MQGDGRAELVHKFAFQADEQCEGVAQLFDADTLGHDPNEAVRASATGTATAPDAILRILTRTPLSGRCARWIMPRPCRATRASLESSSRFWRMTSTALRSPKPFG